jgi:hypothetical protein
MNDSTIINYQGAIAPAFNHAIIIQQLDNIVELINSQDTERLSSGTDYVIKVPLASPTGELMATIKVFKRQNFVKDWHDRRHGSKAERSFRAAIYLQSKGIGTPAPIAWRDRWENGRLLESYYLSLFEPGICLRDALSDIYYNQRNNAPLIDLLHVVAPAVRAMHNAGFMHGDMGNQNILLPRNDDGAWLQPQFIDLNRAQYSDTPLSFKKCAFDIARIALPGAYLKIFKLIYNNHQDFSSEFDKLEQKARTRFWSHRRNSKWRHPIRHWRNKKRAQTKPVYPSIPDIWLWDEKSAQPMIIPSRREKNAHRDWRYIFSMTKQGLCAAPRILRNYRQLLSRSYQQPVAMRNRIGVALHPHSNYIPTELALLEQLGNPPVLIRFCHHETPTDWQRSIDLVKTLRDRGVEVMLAILQDRRALQEPDSWRSFLKLIVENLGDLVTHIEITHASNRLKWGIWNSTEYAQLMAPALELQQRFPQIKLTGPACIDFEYLPVIAALNTLPRNQPLAALSHLLYVDRRGAPESKQGKYSTLEKSALLKAVAQASDRCDDKVIISEVNWPVKYTHIWSPIGCPYETPKWRRNQPGETDDDYANYMLRFLAITLCSGHVEQVFWWRLSAHGYGLVDDLNQFQPRPAFTALAFFLQLIGDATFTKKYQTVDDLYLLEFTKGPERLLMAWHTAGTQALPSEFTPLRGWNSYGQPLETALISSAPSYYLLATNFSDAKEKTS